MIKLFNINRYFIVLGLLVFIFQACKTDEFKFSEITVQEDFGVRIITPIFSGNDKSGHKMEFRDFIHDWSKPIGDLSGPQTILQYSNGSFTPIPTRLIFDKSSIIDSLQFLIQGNYTLKDVELVFKVTNSCPFPLNLQLQFINQNIVGPPVLPSAFDGADFNQLPVTPVTTVHSVSLDSMQLQSFTFSKRLRLSSWYNQNNFINPNDTLSAHYPIDVSIVMIGTVQTKK
ncbi:MAG TPA: hypothetical protein VK872_00955 [Draconibacterium sp.]|nr:hypothetical protein [Draconibacterium sp.]